MTSKTDVVGVELAAGQLERLHDRDDGLDPLDRLQRLGLELVLIADHADDGPRHPLAEVGGEPQVFDPGDDVPDHLVGRVRLQNDDHHCSQNRQPTVARLARSVVPEKIGPDDAGWSGPGRIQDHTSPPPSPKVKIAPTLDFPTIHLRWACNRISKAAWSGVAIPRSTTARSHLGVVGEKSLGIKPETGERDRPIPPIGVRRHDDQFSRLRPVPANLVQVDESDDGIRGLPLALLIGGPFGAEVKPLRAVGDLDHQFGRAPDDSPIVPGLPAKLGQDPEENIGLDLVVRFERGRCVPQSFDSRGPLFVRPQPDHGGIRGPAVVAADRARYVDDSVDPFGLDPGRQRLVSLMKVNLILPLISDQRPIGASDPMGDAHERVTP